MQSDSAIAKLTKAILPRCSFHLAKLLFFLKTAKFSADFLFPSPEMSEGQKKSRRAGCLAGRGKCVYESVTLSLSYIPWKVLMRLSDENKLKLVTFYR